MANSFSIYDESTDEVDQDSTKLFRKMWYRNIIKYYVDSKFHGFSLVQLGDIVSNVFEDSYLVPRHYVIQQKWGVKKELGNVSDLIKFNDPKFRNWIIPIGDPEDLGYVKTKISDVDRKTNAEDMMEEMGLSAWAVLDEEDEIGFLQANRTDISNMYKNFLEFVNSEISKLFLLQTGTTDEKTHVGSAGVMQDILKSLIEAYLTEIEDLTNKKIIPLAQRHGLMPLGRYIKADNEQKLNLKELFDIVQGLMGEYKIAANWISETFEIPLEELSDEEKMKKSQVDLKKEEDDVIQAVNKLYNPEECC